MSERKSGTIEFLQLKTAPNGNPYARVGIRVPGKEKLFFASWFAPRVGLGKGAQVSFALVKKETESGVFWNLVEPKVEKAGAGDKEEESSSRETSIERQVAVKAATELVVAGKVEIGALLHYATTIAEWIGNPPKEEQSQEDDGAGSEPEPEPEMPF